MLIKPDYFARGPDECLSDYVDLWDGLKLALPFGVGAGLRVYNLVSNDVGVLGANMTWRGVENFGTAPFFPGDATGSDLSFATLPITISKFDEFTVVVWYKSILTRPGPPGLQDDSLLFDWNGSGGDLLSMFLTDDSGNVGKVRWRVRSGADDSGTRYSDEDHMTGGMRQFVLTRTRVSASDTNIEVFVDGQPQDSFDKTASGALDLSGGTLFIGDESGTTEQAFGSIPLVMLVHKAWTQEQIMRSFAEPWGMFTASEGAFAGLLGVAPVGGRIMSSLVGAGGLVGVGGIAGAGGGLAG